MNTSVRLADPDQVFTATHAIRFASGEIEEPHEHRFRVILTINGPLNAVGYVLDFTEASRLLGEVLRFMDGSRLLPGEKPDKPVFNPTAETIASRVLRSFRDAAEREGLFSLPLERYRLCLELEEEPGMWAVVESSASLI